MSKSNWRLAEGATVATANMIQMSTPALPTTEGKEVTPVGRDKVQIPLDLFRAKKIYYNTDSEYIENMYKYYEAFSPYTYKDLG